jgi:uncharacterized membrane protein YphA (DoxX/SURF4 family)
VKQVAESLLSHHPVRWLALVALCVPQLVESVEDLTNFNAAIAQMERYGLLPAAPFAAATIVFHLGLSALVIVGVLRWCAALALALITLAAAFATTPYWHLIPRLPREAATDSFYQHVALFGGFLLVAWEDLRGNDD